MYGGYDMIGMIGRLAFTVMAVMELGVAPVKEIPQEKATIVASEDYCCFCDDHELSTKEKCEELLWKCLTDEKNWLDEGTISEEVYKLQIEPFNKALDYLENASEEDIKQMYVELLLANLDWLEEDKAMGEEIDEGFYAYIISEIEDADIEEGYYDN